jgi:phosphatidylethanolamine-binding protein (PEBP) family uncharacterized protein
MPAPLRQTPLLPLVLLVAALLAPPAARAFDSRNVSAEQFACDAAGALTASFAASGGPPDAVGCGAEVLWLASQTMPLIGYGAADAQALYTLLLLDRDAPNAVAPIRSPLIHMAIADIPGADLAGNRVSNASGRALFPYSGPRPPAGSLCHRYYFELYSQNPAVPVELNVSAIGRYAFDFPTWADASSLTRVAAAVSFFQTQNDTFRTGPCGAAPPSQSGALGPAAALAPGAFVAALAALAALLQVQRDATVDAA